MIEKKRQYDSIHTMKTLCAFLVVCLHTRLLGDAAGGFLKAFARMGVPFFFCVSGFFSYRGSEVTAEDRKKRVQKLIKHIWILLGVNLIYILDAICFQHMTLAEMLRRLTGWGFLIGNFSVAGHMWFMRCLIYLEIVVILFEKQLNKYNGIYCLWGIWALDVIICKYSMPLFHFQIPDAYNEILSKFIGNGVVYFFLGWELKRREAILVRKVEKHRKTLLLALLVGVFLLAVEYAAVTHWDINRLTVNYISTLYLTAVSFLLLLAYPSFGRGSAACYTGKYLSMHIYYWHLLVRNYSGSVLAKWMDIPRVRITNSISVFILSLFLALLIVRIKAFRNH